MTLLHAEIAADFLARKTGRPYHVLESQRVTVEPASKSTFARVCQPHEAQTRKVRVYLCIARARLPRSVQPGDPRLVYSTEQPRESRAAEALTPVATAVPAEIPPPWTQITNPEARRGAIIDALREGTQVLWAEVEGLDEYVQVLWAHRETATEGREPDWDTHCAFDILVGPEQSPHRVDYYPNAVATGIMTSHFEFHGPTRGGLSETGYRSNYENVTAQMRASYSTPRDYALAYAESVLAEKSKGRARKGRTARRPSKEGIHA